MKQKNQLSSERKPYEGKEDDFQVAIAQLLDFKGLFWHHVANERKTTLQAGAKLKRKGVKAGVSDCIILEPRGLFHGLFIELKVKGGSVSISQRNFILEARKRFYFCAICWNINEVEAVLSDYLNLKDK